MLDITYIPNSQYSGVFCQFYAGAGMGSVSYYQKKGNTIQQETIYTYDNISNTKERVTTDNELYNSYTNRAISLYHATAEQIKQMGWDAFVSTALK